MRRISILLLLVAVLAGSLAWPPRQSSARSYVRWAYYVPDDPRSYAALQASHPYLDIVSPDAWRLQPDGSITSRIQPRGVAQMRSWGLRGVPMLSNSRWADPMRPFVASPAARPRAARQLAALVIEGGYDGIHFDIEYIQTRDGPALEAFVADVGARIRGDGRLVTMALPAKTARENRDPAFNYARLGRLLDLAVIMAYDYSYAAGKPGPVAPLPWVNQVVDYSLSQIPREKVLLGIPWYGYDWNISARRPGRYVAYGEVAGKQGVHGYDGLIQAPSLYYIANGQRHQVWYENARSVSQKLKIVVNQGLGGWAAWRLGYDDPAIWQLINPRR